MKKFVRIFCIVCAAVVALSTIGGIVYIAQLRRSDQFVHFDKDKLNEVYTALTVLDKDGQAISQPLYLGKNKQVPLAALHDYTYMAFVAVEDKRFFSHHGIDARRVAGAMLHNLQSKSYKEGASTISQQLIKNTHLDNSKTLRRKLNEMMLAVELENQFGKWDILEMYINTIYFGHNAYGIETAANVYFGKNAADLTLSESAVLAGLIKAPNVYAPDKNLDKCTSRRNTVLNLMLQQQIIRQDQYLAALDEPINYTPQSSGNERDYMYFALAEACKLLNMTPAQLYKSDFIIETYCDQSAQQTLCALASEDATTNKEGCTADMSAVVLDKTGGVEACVMRGKTSGGKRQVGSALKPIAVYGPALNEKIITQASPVLDEETDFNGYRPANLGGYNGWTTVKYAVAKSLNVPAVKTLNALTLDKAQRYLAKMDIVGQQNLSLALGNTEGGLDIFQLAQCYAALANNGVFDGAAFVKNIYSPNGLVYSRQPTSRRVFESGANYLMTDMLVNTVETGTAKRLHNAHYQVAAKTGTVGNSDGNSDALVAGYTTQNTFVVWYSGDLPNDVSGSTSPCIFADKLLKKLYAEARPATFVPPRGVVRLDVDKDSLYDDQLVVRCDNGEKFWFDKANQPTETAPKQVYDYRLQARCDGNVVTLQLPDTQGSWRLYRADPKQLLCADTTCHALQIDCDASFFAELYVKNKCVYTTPAVFVHYVAPTPFTSPDLSDFPDFTDFWY